MNSDDIIKIKLALRSTDYVNIKQKMLDEATRKFAMSIDKDIIDGVLREKPLEIFTVSQFEQRDMLDEQICPSCNKKGFRINEFLSPFNGKCAACQPSTDKLLEEVDEFYVIYGNPNSAKPQGVINVGRG